MAITVSPVNDAPVNTVPGAQVVNEDTALALGGISVNDVDGNLSTVQLGVTQGTVTVNLAGGATSAAARTARRPSRSPGTQAQINAALGTLSYQGTLNYNGPDTLTVTSTDGNAVTDMRHGGDHGEPGERCAGEHGAGRAGGERGYGARAGRDQRQ